MTYEKTILIVDDQSDVRKLLKLMLDDGTNEILEASDGQAAIEVIRKYRPDLILLDVMMPGYPNGLELLQVIKRNKIFQPKIIMVSAKGQYQDVLDAAKFNCDAYVVKPFTHQHLLDTIENVMRAE